MSNFHKLEIYRDIYDRLTLAYTDSLYGEDLIVRFIEGDWYESVYNESTDEFDENYIPDIGIRLTALIKKLENQP